MRSQSATASLDLVNILLEYASSQNLDVTALKAAAGLTPVVLENPTARISIEQLGLVWRELARRTSDQNFGLHVGEAADRLSPGGILFAVMTNCATLEKALEKLARYHSLATDFVQLRLSQQGDCAYYLWETVDAAVPLDRHYIEAVFCGIVFPLRRLTQDQVQPVEIHFRHSRPEDTTEHLRIFGCPLVFDCPQNELVLLRTDLARPIFMANAQLLEKLEQFAQEMLDRLYPPHTWTDKVVHSINKSLACGEKPTLDSVAQALAIGPRQLQNKLREEGAAYQTLLDEVRKEMALKYLNEPQITVCDIAFLLGFSEQSAFNHAFKRWTGVTPGDYRKSELSAA